MAPAAQGLQGREVLRALLVPGYSGTDELFPAMGFVIERRALVLESFNCQ